MAKWTFGLDIFTPVEGKPHTSKVTTLEAEGATAEEAYEKIKDQIPAGHKMWYCFSDERGTDEDP
jgi:hypothetical protein